MNCKSTIFLTIVALTSCGFVDGDDRMNLVIQSRDGNIGGVKEYLSKVSDVNFISLKGDSPLNSAVHNGHLDIVQLLIENGALCSFADESGKTAIDIAAENGKLEIQKYFRSVKGCSV